MAVRQPLQQRTAGFTIIELLIASAVFSIVLVMLVAVFIQIGRIYYKGVNLTSTQDSARSALQGIENDIAFAQTAPPAVSAASSGSGSFCIGGHRYAYYLGSQVGSVSPAGLYRETLGSCPTLVQQSVNQTTADQLLGNGMQLNALDVSCLNARCSVHLHVVFYGSGIPISDLSSVFGSASGYNPSYQAKDAQCTGSLTSSQYCATADFSGTVLQRT